MVTHFPRHTETSVPYFVKQFYLRENFRNLNYKVSKIMNIEPRSKLNSLLMKILPGGLLFSEGLKKQGYSDQLLKQYRNSGWLTNLGGLGVRSDGEVKLMRKDGTEAWA